MTERQLFTAIGELDENLVAWATRPPVRHTVPKWCAVAAAAVILLGCVGGFGWKHLHSLPTEYDPNDIPAATEHPTVTTSPTTAPTEPPAPADTHNGLPLLSGSGITTTGIMGSYYYEHAFSFDELRLAKVWTEPPATMTAWKISDAYASDYDMQLSVIRRYATLLGDEGFETAEIDTMKGSDSPSAPGGGRWTQAITTRYRYEISTDHTYLRIRLPQPVPLGEQENWLAEAQALCPALFADMAQPTLFITGGGRGWYAPSDEETMYAEEPYYDVRVYDAADKDGDYAAFLKGIKLYIENDALCEFHIYLPEYYEKLGDYPVLTEQQAREKLDAYVADRLAQGDDDLDENYQVLGVELIYIGDSMSRLRVPVYRFLLTPTDNDYTTTIRNGTGMESYYECYVSAIPEDYWVPDSELVG